MAQQLFNCGVKIRLNKTPPLFELVCLTSLYVELTVTKFLLLCLPVLITETNKNELLITLQEPTLGLACNV